MKGKEENKERGQGKVAAGKGNMKKATNDRQENKINSKEK